MYSYSKMNLIIIPKYHHSIVCPGMNATETWEILIPQTTLDLGLAVNMFYSHIYLNTNNNI